MTIRLPLSQFFFLALFAVSTYASTANDLAVKLQKQLLGSDAVEMQFTVKGEKVTIKADMRSNAVRLETPSLMILSDGKTVWNYKKKSKQVTIDALSNSPQSPFSSPQDLFKFSENYKSRLVSQKSGKSVIAFTPNEKLQKLLKSAGAIQTIELTLVDKKGALSIQSARATNAEGTVEAGKVSIKSVKTSKKSDFSFAPPKGVSVVDLRE